MLQFITAFVLVIAVVVALYFLQIFLCRIRYEWAGLILPFCTFLYSIYVSIDNVENTFHLQFSFGACMSTILIFMFNNFSTFILLIIYRNRSPRGEHFS